METPKIVGKDFSQEERNDFAEKYQEAEKELHFAVEGEVEKSEQDIKDIEFLSECLTDVLVLIGVKKTIEINPDRVHFLNQKDYEEQFPDDKGGGLAKTLQGIFIDYDRFNRFMRFCVSLHEFLHELSHKKFKFNKQTQKFDHYRSGYSVTNSDENGSYNLMNQFNEGMTEYIAENIILRHRDKIKEKFQITDKDFDQALNETYIEERSDISKIMEKIAQAKGESVRDIFIRLARGYFSGEMMHLRDIDRVFGEGTLRKIALK